MGLDAEIPAFDRQSERARAEFKARYVLREVCDRLAELSPEYGEDGTVASADRECSLPLTLAVLSARRDTLSALAPKDPLVAKARRVLEEGYAVR